MVRAPFITKYAAGTTGWRHLCALYGDRGYLISGGIRVNSKANQWSRRQEKKEDLRRLEQLTQEAINPTTPTPGHALGCVCHRCRVSRLGVR